MNTAALQATLNARGVKPPLATDGVAGKKTLAAIDAMLAAAGCNAANWTDVRRLTAAEQIIYKDAGIEVGAIDGLVGEQTRYAREVYEAKLKGDNTPLIWRAEADKIDVPIAVHAAQKWPREEGCQTFFGSPGTHQVTIDLPFPFRIAWEPEKQITRTSCNEKCRDEMVRIWTNTLKHYGLAKLKELRLDMFGGCLNVRKKRGGTGWSMHAFGIAWDVDPDRNQLKWKRAQATLDDALYEPFWQIVEAEGAISLGRARDYDWMHYQFARL